MYGVQPLMYCPFCRGRRGTAYLDLDAVVALYESGTTALDAHASRGERQSLMRFRHRDGHGRAQPCEHMVSGVLDIGVSSGVPRIAGNAAALFSVYLDHTWL